MKFVGISFKIHYSVDKMINNNFKQIDYKNDNLTLISDVTLFMELSFPIERNKIEFFFSKYKQMEFFLNEKLVGFLLPGSQVGLQCELLLRCRHFWMVLKSKHSTSRRNIKMKHFVLSKDPKSKNNVQFTDSYSCLSQSSTQPPLTFQTSITSKTHVCRVGKAKQQTLKNIHWC